MPSPAHTYKQQAWCSQSSEVAMTAHGTGWGHGRDDGYMPREHVASWHHVSRRDVMAVLLGMKWDHVPAKLRRDILESRVHPSVLLLRDHSLDVHEAKWQFACDICVRLLAAGEGRRLLVAGGVGQLDLLLAILQKSTGLANMSPRCLGRSVWAGRGLHATRGRSASITPLRITHLCLLGYLHKQRLLAAPVALPCRVLARMCPAGQLCEGERKRQGRAGRLRKTVTCRGCQLVRATQTVDGVVRS